MPKPIPHIAVIDTMVNMMTPEALKTQPDDRQEFFVDKIGVDTETYRGITIGDLLQRMDSAGVERSFLIASRAGAAHVSHSHHVPYELVVEAVKQHPDRFSGIAGIDPTMGRKGVVELQRAIEDQGFVGAHFYPHWFELPPDHARWYPFYAKCVELDVPVQLQVGQSMIYSPNYRLRTVGQPITLDAVACDFPELKLIGSHVGIPWTGEMIAMAWKHANVFIMSDAHGPKYWPKEFVHYINTYGQDKVMFASGFPVLGFERTLQDIADLNLRPEPLYKFLRGNTERLYRIRH